MCSEDVGKICDVIQQIRTPSEYAGRWNNLPYLQWQDRGAGLLPKLLSWQGLNPFTPKPETLHHIVWRTWLSIVHSADERWLHYQIPISFIYSSSKGGENVFSNLGVESPKTPGKGGAAESGYKVMPGFESKFLPTGLACGCVPGPGKGCATGTPTADWWRHIPLVPASLNSLERPTSVWRSGRLSLDLALLGTGQPLSNTCVTPLRPVDDLVTVLS